MSDAEKQIVADVLKYLHGQLVNDIDNHAGLENPETVRLADAIKQSVKNTEKHFSNL